MSFDIFKQSMNVYMDNQEGIDSYQDLPKNLLWSMIHVYVGDIKP
jgi:hypothetical protein